LVSVLAFRDAALCLSIRAGRHPQRGPGGQRPQAERIAGRENEPAGRVFKNIKLEWFKSVPARQLLDIMNGEYSRALGVRCTHCHVEQDFASDDKRPKRAARGMAAMHWTINQTLAKMGNLESSPEDRFINCATCHRGQVDPHGQPD
jgi:hypothetical protein